MPSRTLPWAWVWAWAWVGAVIGVGIALGDITDLTPNSLPSQPPLSPHFDAVGRDKGVRRGGKGGAGGLCLRGAPRVNPPQVEVIWERNTSQVTVVCHSKLPTLFPLHPSLPTDPPTPPPTTLAPPVATLGARGRGVILNLTQLVQEGEGVQVMVDVEGCGCVGVQAGVPAWVEGVTFAIKGSLELPVRWWGGEGDGLRSMWMRVNEEVSVKGTGQYDGGVCQFLPPTLETVDLSHTWIEELVLREDCAPKYIQRLQASRSMLTNVSLCTPTLKTLSINNNEVEGDMDWAGCAGGLDGVMYLHANDNQLSSASTCSWPSLVTLELRGNLLTSIDLASCPPVNLTTLDASRNFLTSAPLPIPPSLVYLDLRYNNISVLPVLSRTLKEADFSYNSLHEVGEDKFLRARKLHHLNLAHNHIREIKERDFYGLKTLHRLDLSHNSLHTVAASSFIPLHQLRHLHLQHNRLTHLDARDLHALGKHAHATLHHNPWACQCQMLAALTQLQACPDCKHKRIPLNCTERDHQQEVSSLLRTCLHAIQATQGVQDESDEDLSEEQDVEDEGAAGGAVLIVPFLVILIVIGVGLACGYRVYKKHRRVIRSTLSPVFCGCCSGGGGGGGGGGANNNNVNNHHHHQEASQLRSGELQDSDTETEM